MRAFLPGFLAFSLIGCKKPPQAPAELDELCAYLYSHMDDEEDDYLEAGVDNLDAWLQLHIDETSEGYVVQNLDQDTVDNLYGEAQDLTGLVGAAVGNDSAYTVDDIVDTIVLEDQAVVFPDTYELYERTWRAPEEGKEPTCMDDADCSFAEADNHSIANYALGLTAESWSRAQYRWVETDAGMALVNRTWMTQPAELSFDWIHLDDQFFMTVTFPRDDDQHARRLQATWMTATLGDSSVPEATALNMVISSMQGLAEDIETYLSGQ